MSVRVPVVAPVRAFQCYEPELLSAAKRVLAAGSYILDCEVKKFEESFADYCNIEHIVGVANGTDAIALALRSLGIGVGDIVITVSHTAVATVAAIEMVGATPVLVDIDSESYTIDPQKLDDTVTQLRAEGRSPKGVVAVHLYGHACDLAALQDICRRHDLKLIEDCAQAHGARYLGRHVGSFGDASCFSFYPTKNLGAFGDGGAVGFMDKAVSDRCRALREYGWHRRYLSDLPGINSRLDEIQASFLRVRLHHLESELKIRHRAAAMYDEHLGEFVVTPTTRTGCDHAYHLYVVRSEHRDQLAHDLALQGIGTAIHYPVPVHAQEAYKKRIAVGVGGMANTERLCTEILSLPMHGFLNDEDVELVLQAIRRASQA